MERGELFGSGDLMQSTEFIIGIFRKTCRRAYPSAAFKKNNSR